MIPTTVKDLKITSTKVSLSGMQKPTELLQKHRHLIMGDLLSSSKDNKHFHGSN
jgi:hypothetical protein